MSPPPLRTSTLSFHGGRATAAVRFLFASPPKAPTSATASAASSRTAAAAPAILIRGA
jgi:hypothetical protein